MPEIAKSWLYPEADSSVRLNLRQYPLPCFKALLNFRTPIYKEDKIKLFEIKLSLREHAELRTTGPHRGGSEVFEKQFKHHGCGMLSWPLHFTGEDTKFHRLMAGPQAQRWQR